MTKKERRHDNLFSFTRDAQASPKRRANQRELEEALATVLRAIERLAARMDALIGKGGLGRGL